uniref:Uncharacterized protein n=1 Tax=Schistosoma mansoni TaxID=6183 RepID=G4VHK9_SCHMA
MFSTLFILIMAFQLKSVQSMV